MTTTPQYVARCSVCDIAPFSENDPKGLGYTLKRFPDGELYCADHYPPKTRVSRPAPVTARDALDELEKTFAGQIETLAGALAESVESAVEEAIEGLTGKALDALTDEQQALVEGIVEAGNAADGALDGLRKEVERGLAALRKTLPAPEPAQEPKRAKPKPVTRGRPHRGQNDLLAGDEAEEPSS